MCIGMLDPLLLVLFLPWYQLTLYLFFSLHLLVLEYLKATIIASTNFIVLVVCGIRQVVI